MDSSLDFFKQPQRDYGGNIVEIEELKTQARKMRGLLLWSLYHHQGATSPIGQPIRKLMGIGKHENLTHEQVVEAQIAAGIR